MQIKRKVTEHPSCGDTAHRIGADLVGGGGEGWCLVVVAARRSFCFNVPLYVG